MAERFSLTNERSIQILARKCMSSRRRRAAFYTFIAMKPVLPGDATDSGQLDWLHQFEAVLFADD